MWQNANVKTVNNLLTEIVKKQIKKRSCSFYSSMHVFFPKKNSFISRPNICPLFKILLSKYMAHCNVENVNYIQNNGLRLTIRLKGAADRGDSSL